MILLLLQMTILPLFELDVLPHLQLVSLGVRLYGILAFLIGDPSIFS